MLIHMNIFHSYCLCLSRVLLSICLWRHGGTNASFLSFNYLQVHTENQWPDPGRGQTQSTVCISNIATFLKYSFEGALTHLLTWFVVCIGIKVIGMLTCSSFIRSGPVKTGVHQKSARLTFLHRQPAAEPQIKQRALVSANSKPGHFTSQSPWDKSQKANI